MADGMHGMLPGGAEAGSRRARPAPVAAPRLGGLRLAAVLVPLLALVVLGLESRASLRAEAAARIQRTAEMLVEQARGTLEAQEIALAAAGVQLGRLDWPEIRGSAELHALLRTLEALTPASAGLGILDPAGRLAIASAAPLPAPPVDLSLRDYRAGVAAQGPEGPLFVGAPVVARPTGQPAIPLARALPAAPGRAPGGIVVAALRPGHFESFYRDIRETPDDAVMLLRRDGTVLASVPDPRGPPADRAALLRALRDAPAPPGPAALAPDGIARLTVVRLVPGFEVAVAYGLGPGALRRAWLQQMAAAAAGALVVALLLLALIQAAERAMRARAALEGRSRRAERQATLGLLAGGLSHDFGNITQSILAAAQLLDRHAEDPTRVRLVAQHLGRHAARAVSLCRRMLDATRRGTAPSQRDAPVQVRAALQELAALLDATLAPGLRVACASGPEVHGIGFGRAELETAVIHLVANARDAMPGGGEVRIEVDRLALDAPDLAALGLPRHPWVRVRVVDRGRGMDAEAMRRFGEAFFSTKPAGEGSGLGGAMVAALARAAGGMVRVDSTPGAGSRVELLLPAL
jgi:two-component system NtrC family sensor kinase